MLQRLEVLVFTAALVFLIVLSAPSASQAESLAVPDFAGTPYDLINAVNALRASHRLSAYSINPILMFTAQNQADFMAATGNVTHTGAGGSSVTSRLLAAGYPLAGNLSFLPTTGGAPQAVVTTVNGESTAPVGEAVVYPVVLATPNVDGNVIHEVKIGQSLWQIAVAYEVKIDDIKRLNNLSNNNIYPGDKLLIKKDVTLPTASPTASAASEVLSSSTSTPLPAIAPVQPTDTLIPSPVITSDGATQNNKWTITGSHLFG